MLITKSLMPFGHDSSVGSCLALSMALLAPSTNLMAQQVTNKTPTAQAEAKGVDMEKQPVKPQFKIVVPPVKARVPAETAATAARDLSRQDPRPQTVDVQPSAAPSARRAQGESASAASARSMKGLTPPLRAAELHRLSTSVLKENGVVVSHPSQAVAGLPSALLNDRAKVASMLGDLRRIDAVRSGPMTLYRRIAPSETDRETQTAADAVAPGERASVTAGAGLFDVVARGAATRRCTEVSLALDRYELNIRSVGLADPSVVAGSREFWDSVERNNMPLLAKYRQAAKEFTDACLDSDLKTLTVKQRAALDLVLGHLFIDGVPSCMGTRIRADLFLTARHCFYQFSEALGWQPRAMTNAHLTLVGNPEAMFKVQVLSCSAVGGNPDCADLPVDPVAADHLILKIVAPRRAGSSRGLPPMPDMLFEWPIAKQFLVVPGYSSWFTGRPWGSGDKPFATAPAVNGCIVAEVANGCVVNACQSDAGYSGSPMFVRRNVDQLVMVGIFLGSATAYPTCMRSNRNFGASLPSYVANAPAGPVAKGRQ